MLYQNHPASREYCAMAKRMATEQGSEICGTAMQLMGPEGLLQVKIFAFRFLFVWVKLPRICLF
jgi:hypothetical protein